MSRAIEIDLGTTCSCLAHFANSRVEFIANDQGNRTTPSFVAFDETKRLVGDRSKTQAAFNPENTVFAVKRLVGRKFWDPETQKDIKHFLFKVFDKADKPIVEANYKGQTRHFSSEEISSMVLTRMKETAESHLGGKVKDAVITVPAYFNDSQRRATKYAAIIAGLNVLRIINEPTAAAIAYGLDRASDRGHIALVFNLGGGAFNVFYFASVMVFRRSRLLLVTPTSEAKRALSRNTRASIEIDSFYQGIDLDTSINRIGFEDLCTDLFCTTITLVDNVLRDLETERSQVDAIVMVGGLTRIPKIQELVSDYFDGKSLKCSINLDEAVAYGAAVQVSILAGESFSRTKSLRFVDVNPLTDVRY